MFSICDSKAAIFYPPMFKGTHGEAEREFQNLANHKETSIGRNPEDFDMYYLGTYDNNTGKMTPLDTPQHVQKAVFLIKKDPQTPDLKQV